VVAFVIARDKEQAQKTYAQEVDLPVEIVEDQIEFWDVSDVETMIADGV